MQQAFLSQLFNAIPPDSEWQFPPPGSEWDLSLLVHKEGTFQGFPDEWLDEIDVFSPFVNLRLSSAFVESILMVPNPEVEILEDGVLEWLDAPVYKADIPQDWVQGTIQKLKNLARRSGLLSFKGIEFEEIRSDKAVFLERMNWTQADQRLWAALLNFSLALEKGEITGFFAKSLENLISSWDNWFNTQAYIVPDQPGRQRFNIMLILSIWLKVEQLMKEWPTYPSA